MYIVTPLQEIVIRARDLMKPILQRLSNPMVAEQAAILGTFNQTLLEDGETASQLANALARRLDGLSVESERGWTVQIIDGGGLEFAGTHNKWKDLAFDELAGKSGAATWPWSAL